MYTVHYARWFIGGETDRMTVEVSDDDGDTWTLVESFSSDPKGWSVFDFDPAEFVDLTDAMRLRFSAADITNNSLTEAGLDALLIEGIGCQEDGCVRDPEWQCDGDVDGDGQVNPVDSGLVQAAFGSLDERDLCNFDLDCDRQINPVDSGIVQSLFGTCETPREVCP